MRDVDVERLASLAKRDNRRYFVFPTQSVRDIGGYFDVWEVWHVADDSPLCECFSEDVAVTICHALEAYAGGEATITDDDDTKEIYPAAEIENPRIARIMTMPNGMVAVFDQRGEQIPALQGAWEEVGAKLFAARNAQMEETGKAPIIEDYGRVWYR